MCWRRIQPLLWIIGVTLLTGSLVGAAWMLDGDPPGPSPASDLGDQELTQAVVCFGYVDTDSGPIPLWPTLFPQPMQVRAIDSTAKEGSLVKKGQLLVQFDDTLAKLKLIEAEAGVRAAKASLADAQYQVEQGLTQWKSLVQQQELAIAGKLSEIAVLQTKEQQKLTLLKDGSSNDFEIRQIREGIRGLEAGLKAEQLKLDLLKASRPDTQSGPAKARAAVERTEQLVEQAREAVDRHRLLAPQDGTILRNLTTLGMQYGPQSKQPVFVFLPKGDFIVRAEVEQEFAHRVRVGLTALLEDPVDRTQRWQGRVLEVANSFLPRRTAMLLPDPLQLNETRMLEFLVSIEHNDQLMHPKIGQKLRVSIGIE